MLQVFIRNLSRIYDEAKLKVSKLLEESYTAKLTNLFPESKRESNVDSLVNKFTKIIQDLSIEAGFRYSKADRNPSNENPWFDKECKIEKESLIRAGRSICQEPKNANLRNVLKARKTKFKRLCRRKKRVYYENKIMELDFKNPKKSWKQLKRTFNLKNTGKQFKPHGMEMGDFFTDV